MTIKIGRCFGVNIRREQDAIGKMWLTFVIWYPVARNRLGYRYPSVRWL